MRKKTINKLFDNFLWYLLYTLPLLLMLLYWFKTGSISLVSAMSDAGLSVLTTNPIYDALFSIFGTGGIMPLFTSPDVIAFITYFASVYIIHLAIDFILFIPRLAHNWMSALGGDNE